MQDNKPVSSELFLNEDGSIYRLHYKPEHVAEKIIHVGYPGRVGKFQSDIYLQTGLQSNSF